MYIFNNPQIDMTQYYVTGEFIDHMDCIAVCEFCTKENLRYHFEIKHQTDGNILMVGSSCILQFGATVYAENGEVLIEQVAKAKRLDSIINTYEQRKCLDLITDIVKQDHNFTKLWCDYLQYKYLTPKSALRVFQRLYTNKVVYDPKWFIISLKKKINRLEYNNMNKWEQSIVSKGLTSQQLKSVITQ